MLLNSAERRSLLRPVRSGRDFCLSGKGGVRPRRTGPLLVGDSESSTAGAATAPQCRESGGRGLQRPGHPTLAEALVSRGAGVQAGAITPIHRPAAADPRMVVRLDLVENVAF